VLACIAPLLSNATYQGECVCPPECRQTPPRLPSPGWGTVREGGDGDDSRAEFTSRQLVVCSARRYGAVERGHAGFAGHTVMVALGIALRQMAAQRNVAVLVRAPHAASLRAALPLCALRARGRESAACRWWQRMCPSFEGRSLYIYSVAPCQTLALRFATFFHRCMTSGPRDTAAVHQPQRGGRP
jgi:hypothetical protein